MEHVNLSLHRSTKHRGEHGNTVTDPIAVEIPSSAEIGDTIVIDTGPYDSTYLSMKLMRGNLTAGLTVNVGVRDCDSNHSVPGFFSGGPKDLSTPGSDELIINGPVTPVYPDNHPTKPRRKFEHEIYVTLGGTVTPGETFYLVTQMIAHGAPAG